MVQRVSNVIDGMRSDALYRMDGSSSITSSIMDYEFENGRRYHAYKAGRKQVFPCKIYNVND